MSSADVLDFWFSDAVRPRWWAKDPDFDQLVALRLGALHEAAFRGDLDGWKRTAEGALALVILLDQVPRNIFRGEARSFAADPLALAVTREALAAGFDRALPSDEHRVFLYLPLEHSEELADQEACCRLMADLDAARWLDYAERHRTIIARFGRFPHRNAILGRESTAEELAFLTEPGSSF